MKNTFNRYYQIGFSALVPQYGLAIFLFTQCLIYVLVFGDRLWHPNDFMFHNEFDGLKNYFTFIAYIQQGSNTVPFWLDIMNYPFGESIMYTDNTPLLASLVRWFSNNIYDCSGYGVGIFNYFFFVSLFVGGIYLFLIGRHLKIQVGLSILMACCLTFISPQFIKISGHFNMALPIFLLAPIYYLLKVWAFRSLKQPSVYYKYLLLCSLFVLVSGLVHLYLWLINLVTVGIFLLALYIQFLRDKKLKDLLYTSVCILVFAVLTVPIVLQWLDPWYAQRPGQVLGYNKYVVYLSDMFTRPGFYSFPNIATKNFWPGENYSFMGSTFFPMLLIIIIVLCFKNLRQLVINRITKPSSIFLLLLVGLVGLSISFGYQIRLNAEDSGILNPLHPFRLLTLISDKFEQFRCLNRFFWLFYWAFHILSFFILSKLWRNDKSHGFWKTCVIVISSIYIIDTYDFGSYIRKDFRYENWLNAEWQAKYELDNPEEYQAILPIPFFAVGSESYDLTIDDHSPWSADCFRMALANDLPLMAGKLSRTPHSVSTHIRSVFDTIPYKTLISKLDERPIILAYDTRNVWHVNDSPSNKYIQSTAMNLVDSTNAEVTLLKTIDHVQIYAWKPTKLFPPK